jgi:hypothetical protein
MSRIGRPLSRIVGGICLFFKLQTTIFCSGSWGEQPNKIHQKINFCNFGFSRIFFLASYSKEWKLWLCRYVKYSWLFWFSAMFPKLGKSESYIHTKARAQIPVGTSHITAYHHCKSIFTFLSTVAFLVVKPVQFVR